MDITVNLNLFAALVECLEKQAILDKQTPEVQEQWNKIFTDTQHTARAALNQFLAAHGHGDVRRKEVGMGPILNSSNSSFV